MGRPRYALVRTFVEGFGAARGDDVLSGFQHWISAQPHRQAMRNLVWSSLLLHDVFPERDRSVAVSWDVDDPANADWPRPPDTPVDEDDLVYPDDDALAIEHLFRPLRDYLDARD